PLESPRAFPPLRHLLSRQGAARPSPNSPPSSRRARCRGGHRTREGSLRRADFRITVASSIDEATLREGVIGARRVGASPRLTFDTTKSNYQTMLDLIDMARASVTSTARMAARAMRRMPRAMSTASGGLPFPRRYAPGLTSVTPRAPAIADIVQPALGLAVRRRSRSMIAHAAGARRPAATT